MYQSYRCQRCGNNVPIQNRVMHDSRCQGGQIQLSNSSQNNISYNFNNQMNNNIVSVNTSSMSNPDGTISQIKIETFQNGMKRITTTKYDQFYNKISEQINNEYPNSNNNMISNNNINNNVNIQTTVDQFGNITTTKIEQLPNGQTRTTSITRDRNGQVISQSMNTNFGGNSNMNNMNNIQFNMGMNNMMNGMNSMNRRMNNNIIGMNTMNRRMNNNIINMNPNDMNDVNRSDLNNMNNTNNMNNMMSGMNNMNDNMSNMMANMNNMMNNMSAMFNNIFNNNNNFGNFGMNLNNMMNNMGQEEVNNGLDPAFLNNLPSTKLRDISKLEDDKKNCIICMEDFKVDDEVIFLPCLHIFHKDCILEWLNRHDDCPICKNKINNMNQNI